MSDVRLGQLIESKQERDAIHVAVIPMTAGETLRPAQHVGIIREGVAGLTSNKIGIVDPFLNDVVRKGQRFWLVLFPNTVTGMRHHWSHPAFDKKDDNQSLEESIAWLKNAAVKLGVDYTDLVCEGNALETGDFINNGEDIRNIWYNIEDEFWKHHRVVTGRNTEEDDRGGFTCSC